MQIEEALKEWGLNEKETKIYLSTLKLGQSKVSDIAKKSKILRETTYFVLNSLIDKGLISYVIKSKVKYFEAARPNKFISILKEKEERINSVMNELVSFQKMQIEKPSIELYEGKEGLKTILNDIIQTKKSLYAYANYELFDLLRFAFPRFVKQRIENKIPAKIIQEKVKSLEKRSKHLNKKELLELKFSKIKFKSNVFMYGNKTAFISIIKDEPIGIIIQNKLITDTQRQVFKILWETATEQIK